MASAKALATLAEYERELIAERVNAGIAAAHANGTRFGRPLSNSVVIADKLAIAPEASKPRTRSPTSTDVSTLPSRPTVASVPQSIDCGAPFATWSTRCGVGIPNVPPGARKPRARRGFRQTTFR